MTRHSDLSSPRQVRRVGLHYDQEAFGQFSESIARTLGTARFLVWQTAIVIVWIILNVASAVLRWDKYPFILLNLAFSTQAAYAAPLILLAKNRQEQRERVHTDNDRRVAERTQADTEFLAREISSVRVALADMVTTEDLRDHLDRLTSAVERMAQRLDDIEVQGSKGTLDQPREEAD
ncbi:MAG: putative rane protein [Ilumatobacteraceae bacterium]|nr:putative rane protein [Ilumatobacteraceae bacterium]